MSRSGCGREWLFWLHEVDWSSLRAKDWADRTDGGPPGLQDIGLGGVTRTMSLCNKCGREITFRFIAGVCTPLHLKGGCSDREGHQDDPAKTRVMKCPKCGGMTYYIEHNGGFVWVDELGPPWPKHPCFDTEASRAASRARAAKWVETGGVTVVEHLPRHILKKCEFCSAMVRPSRYLKHVKNVHKTKSHSEASTLDTIPTNGAEGSALDAQSAASNIDGAAVAAASGTGAGMTPPAAEEKLGQAHGEICKELITADRNVEHASEKPGLPCPAEPGETTKPMQVLRLKSFEVKQAPLTCSDIERLPQQIVSATDRGDPATYQGVLLFDILNSLNLPVMCRIRARAASFYMLVGSLDGLRATFSWAEIDPSFTAARVYLVTRRDGKPLPEEDGAFALVVPGDKNRVRWLRRVVALQLRKT